MFQHLTYTLLFWLFTNFTPLCWAALIKAAVWNQRDRQWVKHPHHFIIIFFLSPPPQNGCFVCVRTPIANVLLLLYNQFDLSSIHMLMVVQFLTFPQINCKDCYRQWNTRKKSFYFSHDKLLSIQITCNTSYWPLLFLFMVSLPSVFLS